MRQSPSRLRLVLALIEMPSLPAAVLALAFNLLRVKPRQGRQTAS